MPRRKSPPRSEKEREELNVLLALGTRNGSTMEGLDVPVEYEYTYAQTLDRLIERALVRQEVIDLKNARYFLTDDGLATLADPDEHRAASMQHAARTFQLHLRIAAVAAHFTRARADQAQQPDPGA